MKFEVGEEALFTKGDADWHRDFPYGRIVTIGANNTYDFFANSWLSSPSGYNPETLRSSFSTGTLTRLTLEQKAKIKKLQLFESVQRYLFYKDEDDMDFTHEELEALLLKMKAHRRADDE